MSQIVHSQDGYRRGVVLGLTLAEVILILLFCLLLTAGVLLNEAESKAKKLQEQIEILTRNLPSGSPQIQLPSALMVQLLALLNAGIPVDDILSLLAAMSDSSGSATNSNRAPLVPGELKALLEGLQNIQKERAEAGMPPLTAEALVKSMQAIKNLGADQKIPDDWEKLQAVQSVLDDLIPDGNSGKQFIESVKELEKRSPVSFKTVVSDPQSYSIEKVTPGGPGEHKWPPIIKMSEAEGYYFKLGSAELEEDFKQKLLTIIVPQILDRIAKYDVDVIEVIGHTDEVPLKPGLVSNLDKDLKDVFSGQHSVGDLVASDNAGLGLARASAVVEVLRADGRLAKYRILPLSAAQLTNVDETLSIGADKANVKERRRVEVRTRRHLPAGADDDGN